MVYTLLDPKCADELLKLQLLTFIVNLHEFVKRMKAPSRMNFYFSGNETLISLRKSLVL